MINSYYYDITRPLPYYKVRVNDLWYCDNNIFINVQESSTGSIKEFIVYVNSSPDCRMVRWDDIIKMVRSEYNSSTAEDQLLDCDY